MLQLATRRVQGAQSLDGARAVSRAPRRAAWHQVRSLVRSPLTHAGCRSRRPEWTSQPRAGWRVRCEEAAWGRGLGSARQNQRPHSARSRASLIWQPRTAGATARSQADRSRARRLLRRRAARRRALGRGGPAGGRARCGDDGGPTTRGGAAVRSRAEVAACMHAMPLRARLRRLRHACMQCR